MADINKTVQQNSTADDVLEAEFKIWEQLELVERKMYKACEQIIILDRKLQDLHKRFTDATINMNRTFKYSLKIKIVTLEGVRTAYYEYALMKAEETQNLRKKLVEFPEEETVEYDESYGDDSRESDE
jgi:hypothetical protein